MSEMPSEPVPRTPTASEVARAYEAASEGPSDEVASTEAVTEAASVEPTEPTFARIVAQSGVVAPPDSTAPFQGLRLRMKIWTDRATGKRYLMPSAFMRDVVRGQPVTDVMYAYAMRDDDTKRVTLTVTEWNALPFFYFREDGSAPRATARSVDVLR